METLTLPPPLVPPRASERPEPSRVEGAPVATPVLSRFHSWRAVLAIALALLAAIGLVALRWRLAPERPRYRTETVTIGQVTGVLHTQALIEPTITMRVTSPNVGRVSAVSVAIGDRVHRGQALARLDTRALQADVASAEAHTMGAHAMLRQAEARLSHVVRLLDRHAPAVPQAPDLAIPPPELEAAIVEAEANLVGAVAELQRRAAVLLSMRTQLTDATLRAPMDGIIVGRSVEPGEVVTPVGPLFVLAAHPKELGLVAAVDERDVARVRAGPARFKVTALPGRVFDALVVRVDPAPRQPDAAGRHVRASYGVRLLAPNDGLALRPGMTAVVALPVASPPDTLLVPAAAVLFNEAGTPDLSSGAAVHVLDAAGEPTRVPVEVGVTDGARIEVRGTSLRPGSQVVVGVGSP